ncbi:MAG: VWA domain-containing protein [Acidobacteria bacterium]|nr:VWA domain-containing protein [Acidobacteriota bacterium]
MRLSLLRCGRWLCLWLCCCVLASAQQDIFFRGRVILDNGSPPDKSVVIQRVCEGLRDPIREGGTFRRTGEYTIKLTVTDFGQVYTSTSQFNLLPCRLEASAAGYVSSRIDLTDRRITRNPRLPDLVLSLKSRSMGLEAHPYGGLPRSAARDWERAVELLLARDLSGADAPLRATVAKAPKFAPGWPALGNHFEQQGKAQEARQALERAIALDAKELAVYQMLAQTLLDLKEFQEMAEISQRLIDADRKHIYVDGYLLNAVALFQLKQYDQALARLDEGVRYDRLRELRRAEFIRGVILEAQGNFEAARESMKSYLAANPHAKDATEVRERLAQVGRKPPAEVTLELTSEDLQLAAVGEAPVPGGIRAFSRVAELDSTPSPHDFYLVYCRAITAGARDQLNRTTEARMDVMTFMHIVAALERMGEGNERGTLIRLSTASEAQTNRTRTILAELGWRLVPKGSGYLMKSAGQIDDGLRQRALPAFGVDELDLSNALRDGKEFRFEIPRETARLVGGAAWTLLLKGIPEAAGGPAEVFIRDPRFARVYSGLADMDADSAATLVSALKLANLVVKYSPLAARFAGAIEVQDGRVLVPGGAAAETVWARLAGANPKSVAPFLRALFELDQGRVLAYYHDLARADEAHQKFYTQSVERAGAFLKWYSNSNAPPASALAAEGWQKEILQSLRLDGTGRILFPGGKAAWGEEALPDTEILLRHAPLEALAAVNRLELRRKAPLSAGSARLLAEHYGEWKHLFAYFEKLPALDEAAFAALARFSAEASKAPAAERNLLLGQWHSLVGLILLGSQSGALTASQAAEAFQQACAKMRAPDPTEAALAVLRPLAAGPGGLDDGIPSRLLRLRGDRRKAYEEIRRLQEIPPLDVPGTDGVKALEALSGAVYAATLDPAYLLVAEDRQLLRRHRFLPAGATDSLFFPTELRISNGPEGSAFHGGFGTFPEASAPLRRRSTGARLLDPVQPLAQAAQARPAAQGDSPAVGTEDVVFQARGRVVEVYATVTDGRGRYVDDLKASQFAVLEEGVAKPVVAFESYLSGVSVALVFDTTGSMGRTLPWLKSAALELVDQLRAVDSAAVYNFDESVTEAQPFTEDKEAAKRAILKLRACGITALYEAIVRVNHDLAARPGKKVIVLFTDGADNSSMFSSELAIESAKQRGIPIYTIAQGEATMRSELVASLSHISNATGGTPFLVRQLTDIAGIFEKISEDLMHGYLLAFQPEPGENRAWRKIELVLGGTKGLQVRTREGYYVE